MAVLHKIEIFTGFILKTLLCFNFNSQQIGGHIDDTRFILQTGWSLTENEKQLAFTTLL